MTSGELRKRFLEFFEKRGHKIVPSSSLLPEDDSSVLLTTAGMQQFKLYYTGAKDPVKDFGARRTVSIQKSLRTSDIDEVGDESHLTFFEMLGNFGFGDYFKEDAIKWSWEFITKELGISPERCHVSVFKGDPSTNSGQVVPEDTESIAIWKSLGLGDDKIKKCGREDNFWGPTGDEGPCGPTSEIYVDGVEIWNLVFNQYYCRADKNLEPLKQNGIDTGMGLERLAMISQDAPTIFETDLFEPLIQSIPHKDIENEARAVRIVVDHIRGSVFLIADGILPSNIGAGYILRRLLRRAIRYGKVLDFDKNFLISLAEKVIKMYKEFYPEISIKREDILTVIQKEEEKFYKTLEKGLKELEKTLAAKKEKIISGEDAFHLYESYGFPTELTRELAEERGFNIDESGWETSFKKHREISRAGAEKKFGGHGIATGDRRQATSFKEIDKITRLHTATHLLHQAIHDVLGNEAEVQQRGSDITPERLRFDFAFPRKLTPEELKKIENIVNKKIKLDLPVFSAKMSKEGAIRMGARAFLKDKYPNEVNVYSIGDPDPSKAYSKELCGGPHVARTGEIGEFKIIKEESSSAGIRRIRAVVE
ncbi:alanine--tRNA ligase [Candidatus Azambacteria bacterium]|nr:alanine--tRNA ligase [Candidatus Azambacteria bacterium]